MASKRRWKQRGKGVYRGAKKAVDLSMETMAGIVVGWTDMDQKIPSDIVVLGATAPINGFNKPKKFFRGVMFGNRVKQLVSGSGLNTGGYGVV